MSPMKRAIRHVASVEKKATTKRRVTFFLLGDWVWIRFKEDDSYFDDIISSIDLNRRLMGIPSIYG